MPNILWYRYGYDGIMLSWDVAQFMYREVEFVRLTATEAFGSNDTKEKNASAQHRFVNINGLKPLTYYSLVAEGYKGERLLFSAQRYVLTWPTGKFYIHCIF